MNSYSLIKIVWAIISQQHQNYERIEKWEKLQQIRYVALSRQFLFVVAVVVSSVALFALDNSESPQHNHVMYATNDFHTAISSTMSICACRLSWFFLFEKWVWLFILFIDFSFFHAFLLIIHYNNPNKCRLIRMMHMKLPRENAVCSDFFNSCNRWHIRVVHINVH